MIIKFVCYGVIEIKKGNGLFELLICLEWKVSEVKFLWFEIY